MVQAFKSVAVELNKIRAAYKAEFEILPKVEPPGPLTIKEITVEDWRKRMTAMTYADTRRLFAYTHDELMLEYWSKTEELRLKVALEWQDLVEKGCADNLVRGWMYDAGVYRRLKATVSNHNKESRLVRLNGVNPSQNPPRIYYEYGSRVSGLGLWSFIPFMDGLTVHEQECIASAMTHPLYSLTFEP